MSYIESLEILCLKLYHASTQSLGVITRRHFLEKEKLGLAFGNITTDDDEELLERTFVILEKFVCQIYGAKNSSDVNSVRFNLFSSTFQSKNSNENFEKKFRNFDSSSLPPCKAELYQHLLRVRYVTKLWRNAHLKHPTSLSPVASGWNIIFHSMILSGSWESNYHHQLQILSFKVSKKQKNCTNMSFFFVADDRLLRDDNNACLGHFLYFVGAVSTCWR
mgnify:CR=1 FL=1